MITKKTKIKHYRCLRVKNDSTFNKKTLKDLFDYEPKIFSNDSQLVGFNQTKIEEIVDDIMNEGGWNLISISEDENSMSFHFVRESE